MDEKNSNKYGFYLVYDDSAERKGFKFEPWHYSYKPLSVIFLQRFIDRNLHLKLLRIRLYLEESLLIILFRELSEREFIRH